TGTSLNEGRALVKTAIEAVPDPVKVIRVQVNGRNVDAITPVIGTGGLAGERTLYVPLGKGRNDVRITLVNATGAKTESLVLNHEGDAYLDKRVTRYSLAIAVAMSPAIGNTSANP